MILVLNMPGAQGSSLLHRLQDPQRSRVPTVSRTLVGSKSEISAWHHACVKRARGRDYYGMQVAGWFRGGRMIAEIDLPTRPAEITSYRAKKGETTSSIYALDPLASSG